MIQKIVIDTFVLIIEGFEQLVIMNRIEDSTSFPNGMHSQHGHTNINAFHAGSTSNNGPDGRSTRRIVLDDEVLNGNVCFLGDYSEERR